MTLTENLDLKTAMRTWCQQHNVSITDFATRMGYIYSHGWNLLNGKAPITVEVVGRFVLAFGIESTRDMLALAGVPALGTLPMSTEAVAVETPAAPRRRQRIGRDF